jgi:hypothetical protein
MTDRFVVEADRRVVGLAIRAPGGFKFFSSDSAFSRLEGRTFARARALSNAVAKINRSQRRRQPADNRPMSATGWQ